MRAAVVGVNWGAVHVAALREAGCQVVALVGRDPAATRAVADRVAVPQAVTDLAELDRIAGAGGLDLVSVATPAATHAEVVAQLCAMPGTAGLPVICEKPAVGAAPLWRPPATRAAPLWVNYAFSFLPAAQAIRDRLPAMGRVHSAHCLTTFDLPGTHTPEQWFMDLATHPWSWLVSLLGTPGMGSGSVSSTPERAMLSTDCAGTPVEVGVTREPGFGGIGHEVRINAEAATVRLQGRYRIGHDWQFWSAPGAGQAAGSPPPMLPPGDPWYWANAAAIAAMVAAASGGPVDSRLFGWDSALALDVAAQGAFRRSP